MTTKPDFAAMDGAQLLAAYNQMSATKRKAKFESKAQGIARCEAEWKANGAAKESKAAAAKEPKAAAAKEPKAVATKEPKAAAKEPSAKHVRVIRLAKDTNPRREGTDAHRHYEAMRGSITVGEYLDKFDDRKKAGQWLSNTVRDGHVKLVG